MVRKRLPKVSLGTVYRNLDTLVQTGQIQKIDSGSAEARFDGNPGHHHHVRCLDCGRVEDVLEVPADTTLDEIKEVNGFEITGHHLELIGLCPECRRSAEAQPGGDDTSARI
jgi:Fur family ferric uptake transcriptional regulator